MDNLTNQVNYGSVPAEWPYPVKYGVENRIETDVLIVGAGIAGGLAAVAAAKRGVKVAVVDKAPIIISGSGGAGLDHYLNCISNPDCTFSPEEYMDMPESGKVMGDHRKYITAKNSWNALMELEKMGLKIRDEDGEFEGAAFRDKDSKLMYAYDYQNKNNVRIRGGHYIKQVMFHWLNKNENSEIYERVMITGLLTEGGKEGAPIVGATGLNTQTGEFYVFNAKSVVISCGGISAETWSFNTEMFASGYRMDPNCSGDGIAMAWNAGAKLNGLEQYGDTRAFGNPFGWPWYGVGNPDNTWMPCGVVDNNGKEVPWEDAYGNPISGITARCMPAEGQPYVMNDRPGIIHDLAERIRNGEYELPLWADISALPEDERRGIWGLMICNEGKTRYPIYDYFNKAGFNPDTDMLQCPVMVPENYVDKKKDWFQGEQHVVKFWKADTLRGVATDWNQMTTIEGLFAAGTDSGQASATAGSSGMYAANRAAEYAKKTALKKVDEAQLTAEKERVYAPVKRMGDPSACISWKEMWAGTARVMQQTCDNGFRTIPVCEHGIRWMDSIDKHEARMTYARNPHELWRVLECESRIAVGKVYLYSAIAQIRAEESGEGKGKVIFNQFKDGGLVTTYKEDGWWLKAPYAPTYLENFETHTALEREGK